MAVWIKSSFSFANGNCVEVARVGETVQVRHSGFPAGPVLAFRAAEWEAFLEGVSLGEFNYSHLPEGGGRG